MSQLSNVESLLAAIAKGDSSYLVEPQSRVEALLYEIYLNGGGGGGGSDTDVFLNIPSCTYCESFDRTESGTDEKIAAHMQLVVPSYALELKKEFGWLIYRSNTKPTSKHWDALYKATPNNTDIDPEVTIGKASNVGTNEITKYGVNMAMYDTAKLIDYNYAILRPFIVGIDDRVKYYDPIVIHEDYITFKSQYVNKETFDAAMDSINSTIGDINTTLEAIL